MNIDADPLNVIQVCTESLSALGSYDSVEEFIRTTENKIKNDVFYEGKKTLLLPKQASQLFLLLGQTYLKLKKESEAEEKLIISHVYNKQNFDCLYLLANTYFKRKQIKKADKFYRKAFFTDKTNNPALYGVVLCNVQLKKYDFLIKFTKNFNMNIINNPQICLLFSKAVLGKLNASISTKLPAVEIMKLEELMKDFLQTADFCFKVSTKRYTGKKICRMRNKIAINYFIIKKFQDGIDCLIQLEPEMMNASSYYNLAYAYFKIENLDKAAININICLKSNPKHLKSLLLKAEICKKKGDLKATMQILQELHEKDKMNSIVNKMMGDIFKFKGSFFQALEHYEVFYLIVRLLLMLLPKIKKYKKISIN